MNAFRPLLREARIAYFRWALREICPAHHDVPAIVLALRRALDERNARRCYLQRTTEWL